MILGSLRYGRTLDMNTKLCGKKSRDSRSDLGASPKEGTSSHLATAYCSLTTLLADYIKLAS